MDLEHLTDKCAEIWTPAAWSHFKNAFSVDSGRSWIRKGDDACVVFKSDAKDVLDCVWTAYKSHHSNHLLFIVQSSTVGVGANPAHYRCSIICIRPATITLERQCATAC